VFGWLRRLLGPGESQQVVEEFYSSIAGVSHKNRDGTSRQKIIRESLYAGMPLGLQFEDDNPVDKNAIALLTTGGEQVGYLHARLASEVRDWFASGERVAVTVAEITGGTRDRPTQGVNILVTVTAAERT
jgi:HIRAN domain